MTESSLPTARADQSTHADGRDEPPGPDALPTIKLGPAFEFHPVVFPAAGAVILTLIAIAVLLPGTANDVFSAVQDWIVGTFGWLYILGMSGFLGFALWLGFGPYRRVRLGDDDEKPEFGTLAWFAMLFSAGMGIGLLFWAVAEPINHFVSPPQGRGGDLDDARTAMALTIFHWGLHPWALYAVVALALGYFGFRRKQPLSFRSLFYPFLGERINGRIGDVIDILAVVSTLVGVSTSLGLGAMQVNAGLNHLFGVSLSPVVQVLLIAGITAVATVSVVAGLDKGIRRLSELNMSLAATLLVVTVLAGGALFFFNALVENIGAYLQRLPWNSFWTGTFEEEGRGWLGDWTIFYWAWWIAWSPFVGMFIARVSRGRTFRQFIAGTLLVPTGVCIIWLTAFGSTTLKRHVEVEDARAAGEPVEVATFSVDAAPEADAVEVTTRELTAVEYYNEPDLLAADNETKLTYDQRVATVMFVKLDRYPLSTVLVVIATLCIILFFVTSSDSASMVIDIIASGGNPDPPVGTRLFWAVGEGVVAAVLLLAGGLQALQTASITAALPFSFVLITACVCLAVSLRRHESDAR